MSLEHTLRTLDDQEIKKIARKNRRRGVEIIVLKYRDKLYYHAVSIVKDPQEAYDAVQEVFIKTIREKRFFDEGFQMKAWLFRVTTNLCYNTVRDKKRRAGILETIPLKVPREEKALVPVGHVYEGEVRAEVLDAMDQLTAKHREILLLRYYQDLSYSEIAARLQIKLGTVMSRLSRARSRFMRVIGPEHVTFSEVVFA
jgi:RNA polymerase sigma-70 factor (ECF subfamily)